MTRSSENYGDTTKKALLIQSHVAHGYVGNKAATFPLQYRGWDVDALNSVQYSNHPGYGFYSGFQSSSKELLSIFSQGLVDAMKIHYDVILTGYLPNGDMLREMGRVVGELVGTHPGTKWILDPVLGDNGRLYVEQSTVDVVKDILGNPYNRVSLTTPNQFEMELLTGVKITTLPQLIHAFEEFHRLYPTVRRVVVTSILLPNHEDEYISAFCDMTQPGSPSYYYYSMSRIPAQFFGSGDLLTSLLMDSLQWSNDLPQAVGKSLWLVLQVLKRTYDAQPMTTPPPQSIKDLLLVQCNDLWAIPWSEIPLVNNLVPLP